MNNPKVAVIMSCYNNEDTVKSSVESILNQTYRNFEYYKYIKKRLQQRY